MRPGPARWTGLVLALAAALTARGAADPQLATIVPRGGQRGTEVSVRLTGDRLGDAVDLVFYSPGVTLVSLTPVDRRSVEAVLAIAPDCAIGYHGVRVRTASGISNLRTFSVGSLPELEEAEPNNSADEAQPIELGRVVNGRVTSEDVDFFGFDGVAGERVAIEIEGLRLGDLLFDPAIALIDDAGFEVASCDDHPLLRQDACVVATLPRDGRYVVRVRESAFRGDNRAYYRLHVGRFPRPVGQVPAVAGHEGPGVWLGAEDEVESFVAPETGWPPESHAGWVAPGVVGVVAAGAGGVSPSPNRARASGLPSVVETETGASAGEPSPMPAPGAAHGVLWEAGESDRFVFTASKGEVYDVRAYARRLGSPLDAVVNVWRRGGDGLGGNDDAGGPDSELRVTIPDDGEYVVAIRDHLGKGGPDYFYRIEVARPEGAVVLRAPRDRQAVAVPRGGRAMLVLEVDRRDVDGEVTLAPDGLPEGVSASVAPVPRGIASVPVVFEAGADATMGHGLSAWGPAIDGSPVAGGFSQDIEQVLGQNRVVFWAHTVGRLPVAVAEGAPVSIEVDPPTAPIVQSGSAALRVRAVRREGFEGEIRLGVPFLPPGVGANQSVTIPAGSTEAEIALNAGDRARVGDWQVAVEAVAQTDEGQVRVSSALVPLRVSAPFVAFRPQASSAERGSAASMFIEVSRLEGYRAGATVELAALPHQVSAQAVTLGEETEGVTFDIQTGEESPVGRHRGIFCIARFPTEGGEVVHRLPAGELIIQSPPPPTVDAPPPPPPPPPAQPEAATERPPTRLEKLRMQHEARRSEAGGPADSEGDSEKGAGS